MVRPLKKCVSSFTSIGCWHCSSTHLTCSPVHPSLYTILGEKQKFYIKWCLLNANIQIKRRELYLWIYWWFFCYFLLRYVINHRNIRRFLWSQSAQNMFLYFSVCWNCIPDPQVNVETFSETPKKPSLEKTKS